MHIFLRGLTLDIQRFESLMHYCTQGSNLLQESPIKTHFSYILDLKALQASNIHI